MSYRPTSQKSNLTVGFSNELRHLRDVIRVLVWRDQRGRYTTTLMGVVWAVAAPVLFLMTFYFLFTFVMPLAIPNYASHVFVGLVAWTWFQSTVSESVGCIVGNQSLISQPRFPVAALPVASAMSNLLTLCLTLPVLLLVLLAEGSQAGLSLVTLPVILLCQLVVILAIAFLVAALNVRFRDLGYIVPILLQLFMFATPIFYDYAAVPDRARAVLALNPLVTLVQSYREVLILGGWPDWTSLGLVFVGGMVALLLTWRYFRTASADFLEEV